MARAKVLLAHAVPLPHGRASTKLLRNDIFRSSWMYAVGALDAYFCDAYADLVARILKAKSIQNNLRLTEAIENILFPVGAIFAETNIRENWKWRLAARDLIEKDNMVSINKIQKLFNPFLRNGHKLFEASVIDDWIKNKRAPQRLVAISKTNFAVLAGNLLDGARKTARKKIVARYGEILQRRHDCIHNCDRPKLSLQSISQTSTEKSLADVSFLVEYCDKHFESEFNHYLHTIGANAQTRNRAGY